MSIPLGQPVHLSVTFTATVSNVPNTPADPDVVTLTIGDATGSPTVYTYGVGGVITKTGTGIYAADVTPDAAGTWLARWVGSGTVDAVFETEFDVLPSAAPWTGTEPPSYATLSQLKDRIGLNPALAGNSANLASRDDVLRGILQSASRQIDGEVARRSAGAVTKFYDDLDWPTVPAPITEATILLAIALWERKNAPFGIVQSTIDGSPITIGNDQHVGALIDSVVPPLWSVV